MPCYDNRDDVERERLRNLLEEGGFTPQTYYPPPSQPMWSTTTKTPVTIKVPEGQIDRTALLCSACRVLARMGYDFEENPALSQWWDAHQKEDAKK
jgi:hypothetical protein